MNIVERSKNWPFPIVGTVPKRAKTLRELQIQLDEIKKKIIEKHKDVLVSLHSRSP